ncbi:MAG TPA: hypothetical protein VIN75_16680 [Burkholderiaceae bacterium]
MSLLLVFAADSVSCQSMPYQDADSVGEAFGMMMMSIRMSELLSAECGKRYPDDAAS